MSERLGHRFCNKDLLRQALTHPSATADGLESYERLEFLGDRVLGLVIAEYLLARFPGEREGDIARRHTALVRRETAAEIGAALGLDAYLEVSKGEGEAGTATNPAILADALEAVIAALYLDGGIQAAHTFISRYWDDRLGTTHEPPREPKTTLQEWAQARALPLPRYRESARTGPPHAPRFTVTLSIDGADDVVGEGSSKRRAEQAAATAMLEQLGV